VDLRPLLFGKGPSARETVWFYRGSELFAVRHRDYKAHYITQAAYGAEPAKKMHDTPLLYHMTADPSEKFDVAAKHPDVLAGIAKVVEQHRSTLKIAPSQFDLTVAAGK
jgi:arylsulfatase A-like enzyme